MSKAFLVELIGVLLAASCIWLTVRIINRSERWAKRTLAYIIILPVLYILSWGPALRVASQRQTPRSVRDGYRVIYAPIATAGIGPKLPAISRGKVLQPGAQRGEQPIHRRAVARPCCAEIFCRWPWLQHLLSIKTPKGGVRQVSIATRWRSPSQASRAPGASQGIRAMYR